MIQTRIDYRLHYMTDMGIDLGRIAATGRVLGGEYVKKFERAWAEYCGTERCICCASGEAALELAARLSGMDRVAVQANTLPATLRGLLDGIDFAGQDAVELIDVDEWGRLRYVPCKSYKHRLVPVMLYGAQEWITKEPVLVMDCCQAHGMKHHRDASLAAWSFYPTKNLGGITDGGCITGNSWLGIDCRREKQVCMKMGYRGRMNDVTAAFLLKTLPMLDEWNHQRREIGMRYHRQLLSHVRMPIHPNASNGHLFPVLVNDACSVAKEMKYRGVLVGRHYPEALNRSMPMLNTTDGEVPGATAWCKSVITLPIYPGMPHEDVDRVVEALVETVSS